MVCATCPACLRSCGELAQRGPLLRERSHAPGRWLPPGSAQRRWLGLNPAGELHSRLPRAAAPRRFPSSRPCSPPDFALSLALHEVFAQANVQQQTDTVGQMGWAMSPTERRMAPLSSWAPTDRLIPPLSSSATSPSPPP